MALSWKIRAQPVKDGSLGMSVDVSASKHVMHRVKVEGWRLAKQTIVFKVPEAAEVLSPIKLL